VDRFVQRFITFWVARPRTFHQVINYHEDNLLLRVCISGGYVGFRCPQDVRAAGCVISKALAAYRILAAVTARENDILL
jgi:hypothetical protein